MFVPAQGVVQTKTKGGTKYLQIVTDQSPIDSQSLANQSLTTSKSNEMLSLKRRSASLPDKLNNHSLGTDQIDTWLSTFGRLQEQSPDLSSSEGGGGLATTDDKPSLPLRVTNPSASSDAQSSTATESVRLVPNSEQQPASNEIKTSYAVAMDAKAALFSNPPSCLTTPTAIITAESVSPVVTPAAEEDDQRRPTTSDTDRTIQEDASTLQKKGQQQQPPRRPREKTSSERLAGQGINVRRGPSSHSNKKGGEHRASLPVSSSGSSSTYSADEAGGANNHARVDSVMTDTSSSSASSSGSSTSTDRDELRNGALHLTRRSRDDKIRARKLRDLQRRRKKSSGGGGAVRHGIDEIITQPLNEEEPAVPSPDHLERARLLRRKNESASLRPVSLVVPSPSEPTGYTPRSDGDGRMALTPVVTVAEQMPVPRGRCVRKPARLVLRDELPPLHLHHHRRRSSAGAPARRVVAVRTSLSAPPAVVGGGSRDDVDAVSDAAQRRRREASPSAATSRRASSLKAAPGRDEQLRELRAHLHRDQHLLQHNLPCDNDDNQVASLPAPSSTGRDHRGAMRDLHAPPPATAHHHPPACRDSVATSTSSTSNGFGYYFPHSHSHSHSHSSGSGSGTRFSNHTLATPSAMSVASGPASQQQQQLAHARSGGKDVLEARVEALERQNRLLEAALQAVLRTSGMLNRCARMGLVTL
ncbi:hypothetical protein GTA08_BOTSDO07465 [Neofusicoccum parvum]|uniref:Uncharacterized protein n=1 Tax=Neofusicoccum parvum TaxID=310453 RepID=A0ACB5SN06_9PEZI|nr:hypothetical protein GTA08_BOTSDO07465 [Neofusicoccum parvum]